MSNNLQRKSARDLFDPLQDQEVLQEALRVAEALVFASPEPIDEDYIAKKLNPGLNVKDVMETLAEDYAGRGVTLKRVAGKWMFRTAEDLTGALRDERVELKKLTRAQLETLAIIVYHQPVTRAEIEEIRGVTTSKGTLDVLLTTGWIRMRGRRKTPGRPVTYGTTDAFLIHFGLDSIKDLPGLDELKGAGLLDARLPSGFSIPSPNDEAQLTDDEDPLDEQDIAEEMALMPQIEEEEAPDVSTESEEEPS